MTLSKGNDALYFFADIETKSTIWRHAPETLRDALFAVGEAVIANHDD